MSLTLTVALIEEEKDYRLPPITIS